VLRLIKRIPERQPVATTAAFQIRRRSVFQTRADRPVRSHFQFRHALELRNRGQFLGAGGRRFESGQPDQAADRDRGARHAAAT